MELPYLIFDLETDSIDSNTAKLKWFGAYSSLTEEYYIFDFKKNCQILDLIKQHKVLIGFNIKQFDIPIAERYGISFRGKVVVDLWEALAPKGQDGFGITNKDRLKDINPQLELKSYSLKEIIKILNLDEVGKGDIDYNIFKKSEWISEEKIEIEKYLKQDLSLIKKLFDWYKKTFEPLEKYLPKEEVERCRHLTCSSGTLAYKTICKIAGLSSDWADSTERKQKIEGGHHIHPRFEKVRGNIISFDFVSAYPHALIQGNLFSQDLEGWNGKPYFNLKGIYNNQSKGKIEEALTLLLEERLKAKKEKDKSTALALKIPINSVYGITGNPAFKSLYNPTTASDCTSIVRTLLKKLCKTIDINGFIPLYGFTDSVYTLIPKELSEEDLKIVIKFFIAEAKKQFPFQIDSFTMDVEKRVKFMWFIEKKDNNYLWVDDKNNVGMKGGALFDINTPESIKRVFEYYIKPKIIKELDVNFTEQELIDKLKETLTQNPELSAEEYKVKDLSLYKIKTSLQYQISNRYGVGRHFLIPNISNVGIGLGKDKKYCTLEEFKEHNLTIDSISIDKMKKYLKPFYSNKEGVMEL